jgi:ribosome biogenesis GTPase
MAPKFKGDSDDWLDDEDSSSGGRATKAKPAPKGERARVPASEANGTVSEVYQNQCRVLLDSADPALPPRKLLCNYRRAGVVGFSKTERTPVAVGDRVKVGEITGEFAVVEALTHRLNQLSRPAPGNDNKLLQHVLAANVDQVVIVASIANPEFSPGLVDRFLIACAAAGIPAVICVSKEDLNPEHQGGPWDLYAELGYEVRRVSIRGDLTEAQGLRASLIGKTVVFCGKSGVGKTSLLRFLLDSDIGKVGNVSEATGKGKHTTSSAVLIGGPEGSRWIDTPGVREFGLQGVEPGDLREYYPELKGVSCALGDNCLHLDEEGCGARGLTRYDSYRRIYESLASGEA